MIKDQAIRFLAEFWAMMGEMAPYLLFGFLVAGVLNVLVPAEWVVKHLGKRGLRQTIKATLLGVPMPLCSCGVIPVAASLRRHGAGKGATTAFLAATPQTGVDSIMATWGMLGGFLTLMRVFAAFLSGISAGVFTDWLDHDPPRKPESDDASPPPAAHLPWRTKIKHIFQYGFLILPADIGKSLLVGLLIAGAISAITPDGFIKNHLGQDWLIYLVLTLIAVPMYVCSTGSIPLALAFMRAGASPGAALVFLIAGPATNAATVATLWKLVGHKATIIYLASIISTSWLVGWSIDRLPASAELCHTGHAMSSSWAYWRNQASAILLAGVLVNALRPRKKTVACKSCENDLCHESEWTFHISGMRCSHCASTIQHALENTKGVEKATVDIATRQASVIANHNMKDKIFSIVRELGYSPEP